jgi:hypothetical protein
LAHFDIQVISWSVTNQSSRLKQNRNHRSSLLQLIAADAPKEKNYLIQHWMWLSHVTFCNGYHLQLIKSNNTDGASMKDIAAGFGLGVGVGYFVNLTKIFVI